MFQLRMHTQEEVFCTLNSTRKRDETTDLGFKTSKPVDGAPRSVYDEIYLNLHQITRDILNNQHQLKRKLGKMLGASWQTYPIVKEKNFCMRGSEPWP